MELVDKIRTQNSVNNLVHLCHQASRSAGWWDDVTEDQIKYVVPTKIALIHSEISEALEGFRKSSLDNHLPTRPSIEVELADALVRIFDLAGFLDLDLGGGFVEKLDYNRFREDHKLEARNSPGGKII